MQMLLCTYTTWKLTKRLADSEDSDADGSDSNFDDSDSDFKVMVLKTTRMVLNHEVSVVTPALRGDGLFSNKQTSCRKYVRLPHPNPQ